MTAAVRAIFEDDMDRPLLIIGNGPSAAMPRHEMLPDDPVVFRMNWFFLEDRYHFGRKVDGFFFSIPNEELEHRMQVVIQERWYDVRAIFSPMRVPLGRDGETHRSTLYQTSVPELDHWTMIAEQPHLARFMMSRPLPTQGMQVLAVALSLGFQDIYLCGIDMYESQEARYGYAIPDVVAGALDVKDLQQGYKDTHSLDRDIDFLDTCLELFPDAAVHHIGPSRHLRARLPTPDRRDGVNTFDGVPATEISAASKPVFVADHPAATVVVGLSDELSYEMIDGRRCGFVTLVSGPFHHGARALARSLQKVSSVPLTVMCTSSADRAKLRASGLVCIDIPEILNPNLLSAATRRFGPTYTKLQAFRMTHLDRAVYVDSDMIVLQPIDDLFAGHGFSAVADHGIDHHYDRFNSGLFAYEPDVATLDRLVDVVRTTGSYDQGDQGFLNECFPDWQPLPHAFNISKRWSAHHPNMFRLEDAKVIHYVGVKPWQLEPESPHDELYRLWFSFLAKEELVDVIEHLRTQDRSAAAVPTVGMPAALTPARGKADRLVGGVFRRQQLPELCRHDWAKGTLLRRAQARARDDEPDEAAELLLAEWPGDSNATPGLHFELVRSFLLGGHVRDAEAAVARALDTYPDYKRLRWKRRVVHAAASVDRATAGMIPRSWFAAAARTSARA